MGLFGKKSTDVERAEKLFSPYIDGQVTAEERRFLERYLADHAQAREKFELLKRAVQLTKTLPPVKAPRSFVLPRSMARQPALRLRSGWALRLYPVMRFATVAAAALFVFALVGDLATSSRLAPAAPAANVLSARSVEPEAATQESAGALAAVAPTPAATATPAGVDAQRATSTDIAGADGIEATEAPAAAAEFAAPTSSPPSEPQETMPRQAEPAATSGAAATQLGDQFQAEADAAAEVTGAVQIDVLRLAVMTLAGLVVVLAAATLVVRRRVR